MALFNENELIEKGRKAVMRANAGSHYTKDARTIMNESAKRASIFSEFDIFLSHSYLDANLIAGLKEDISEMGYSVYVDWLEDSQLDRNKVSKETADILRKRMKQCKCLFFATSENSELSKWMPWECGYFDGFKGKVAICPIAKSGTRHEYNRQEYLSLYPYIQKDRPKNGGAQTLWIHESRAQYIRFALWLNGEQPFERK